MIKTGKELAAACLDVAQNYKTLYIMGCFGAPMTQSNKARYTKNHEYNTKATRKKMINAASEDTFGFDCVCLIKGLLWGWNGSVDKVYGGASYGSNGVPDIGADQIIKKCSGVSTDFSNIQVGELLWMQGHVGIYIGDGLCVECTPAWKNCVQITAVHNVSKNSSYNGRSWTKHGKLPHVTYDASATPAVPVAPNVSTTPAVSATQAKTITGLPTLKKGSEGASVKALQILLIGYGYSCGGYGADGDFGNATDEALRAYQKANGLVVDGICGTKTWVKLLGVM